MSYMCISGYVYVDLQSEEQVEKALKKNKDYIGEKYPISYTCRSVSIWTVTEFLFLYAIIVDLT